jgi:hypothetical protein
LLSTPLTITSFKNECPVMLTPITQEDGILYFAKSDEGQTNCCYMDSIKTFKEITQNKDGFTKCPTSRNSIWWLIKLSQLPADLITMLTIHDNVVES